MMTTKLHLPTTTKISLYLFFFFTILTGFAQQIDVLGNGQSISDGDNTPSLNDYTDFGSATSRTFTIDNSQNTGNTTLNVTSITLDNSTDFSVTVNPTPVGIGKNGPNANFVITLNTLTSGTYTSLVSIASDASNDGLDNLLTFTISADISPEIEITDSGSTSINTGGNFDFGTIPPNSSSSETFSIKNISNGSTTLNLTGSPIVDISGDSEFTISAQPSGTSIVGGNNLTFTVNYNPLAIGSHSATISIDNDDPDDSENPYTFTVQGIGNNVTYTPTTDGPDWTVTNLTSNLELDNPNTIIYGPDDQLWITERVGKKVVKIDPVLGGTKATMLDLTGVVYQTGGQDGLMGIAVHPDLYANINTSTNNYVYLAYTYNSSGRKVRIARYTYDVGTGTLNSGSATTILEGFDGSNDHNSGKLQIGPDMKLYYTAGDQGYNQFANACLETRAQYLPTSGGQTTLTGDKSEYKGKILRMELDGSIPLDNPTLGGFKTHIYTYGHRNPQGLVFGSNGTLYSSEHGAKVDDELNIIVAGKNYGWPLIAGYYDNLGYQYCNWSSSSVCGSTPFSDDTCPPDVTPLTEYDSYPSIPPVDFQEPIGTYNSTSSSIPTGGFLTWPTVAPASLSIYEAGLIPDWGTSLLIPTLKRGTIFRAKLNVAGDGLESQVYEEFHSSNDRYRDIAVGPDGITFYAITDSSGSTSGPSGTNPQTLVNPGVVMKIQYVGVTLNTNAIETTPFTFNLVPNPTSNTFKLRFNSKFNDGAPLNIQIIDAQGRNVEQLENVSNNTIISASSLNNGLYFVKIQDTNRKVIGIKKLIVKH